jgi:16S rRNA G966 N2-methylase RsmD
MKNTRPLQKQIQALPTYLGGKRQLLTWLNTTLAMACPSVTWNELTFIDLFMGGGAVSFWAKAQGFQTIISNDISQRSQILGDAFLRNPSTLLTKTDTLSLTQPLPELPGFIETTFCPMVFSTRHARALDQGFYWAGQHPDLTKRALLTTLMWHMANDFVTFATSLGSSNRPFAEALDGLRSWDGINPKRFNDGSLKSLCAPTWANLEKKRLLINGGVLGGSPVELYQQDALTLLPQLRGDILYLDPPYAGTVSYERGNQVLDALLAGEKPSETPHVSVFSKGTVPLEALLAQAGHIPVWLLSYGNQSLTLAELEALVQTYAGPRTVLGFSKRYQHLSHVSKQDNNQELLILAYPSGGELV